MSKSFDQIYLGGLNGPLAVGKFKLAEAGIGWKNLTTGQFVTVSATEIQKMSWLRVCKEFQLKIIKKDGNCVRFDGFPKEAFDELSSAIKSYYQLNLEAKESSLRGWNWGNVDFSGSNLSFSVANKQAFEVPLTQVANTSLASKNEVMIEFAPPEHVDENGKATKTKEDVLVEMRFYVPGLATAGKTEESQGTTRFKDVDVSAQSNQEEGEVQAADEEHVLGEDGEALTAAAVFCETIKQKADLGTIQSESIVQFEELLCLVPRGRFELQMHQSFLRLRGKSHDYKILYSALTKLFLLPKPDDLHWMFVIGLDPPIRQGQTRYPYLVFQFEKDEELEAELNLTDEFIQEQYKGTLQKSYDGPIYEVVSQVFSGLSARKLITHGTFRSYQSQMAVKCAQKANEMLLYPLERSFLAIPKPTLQILHSDISIITFSRVGGSNLRTFEMKISYGGGSEIVFSSIAREELDALQDYCRSKKLRIQSEMTDDMDAGFDEVSDESEQEDGLNTTKRVADAMDEDSESEDEDFAANSESDVEEEFDEDYSSEGDEDSPMQAESSKDAKKSSKKSEKEEKQPVKKKQKKDPNAPKRPVSSFILFSQEKRPGLAAEHPEWSIGDIGKQLGQLWKIISAQEKQKFEDLAKKDKERYDREMEIYKATGGSVPKKTEESPKKKIPQTEQKFKSEEFLSDSDS